MSPVGSVMCFVASCDTGLKLSRRASCWGGPFYFCVCHQSVSFGWGVHNAGSEEILPGQDLAICCQYCHMFVYENAVEGC